MTDLFAGLRIEEMKEDHILRYAEAFLTTWPDYPFGDALRRVWLLGNICLQYDKDLAARLHKLAEKMEAAMERLP